MHWKDQLKYLESFHLCQFVIALVYHSFKCQYCGCENCIDWRLMLMSIITEWAMSMPISVCKKWPYVLSYLIIYTLNSFASQWHIFVQFYYIFRIDTYTSIGVAAFSKIICYWCDLKIFPSDILAGLISWQDIRTFPTAT